MYYGGIEAGGTKFVYGIGDEHGNIIERFTCPTTTPEETFAEVIAYFKTKDIKALGIGTFGPVDLIPSSPTYGYITSTPKAHWENTDFLNHFTSQLGVPVSITTDVNAAMLGEYKWGAAKGASNCMYITIGTGIGGGILINNNLVQGFSHPELGHIKLPKHTDDDFIGCCPYHHDCFEGLASGPAINARWEVSGDNLPQDHKAWEIQAFYIANALINYIYIFAPERIILGGGVMKQTQLFPLIRKEVRALSNHYLKHPLLDGGISQLIVPPALGDDAGLKGAISLALQQ